MIFDKIFGKLRYAKIKEAKDELDEMRAEKDKWCRAYNREVMMHQKTIEARDNVLKINEGLASENDKLREREAELKAALCDEIQKRFEIIELLAESQIVIKEPEIESEEAAIWKDAKKAPPKNTKDVVVWSETGFDIGYYTEKYGWVRKDGIVFKVKYWRELSEPDVFETKGE